MLVRLVTALNMTIANLMYGMFACKKKLYFMNVPALIFTAMKHYHLVLQ